MLLFPCPLPAWGLLFPWPLLKFFRLSASRHHPFENSPHASCFSHFLFLIPAGLYPRLFVCSSTVILLHSLPMLLFPCPLPALGLPFPWPLLKFFRLSAPRLSSHYAFHELLRSFRSPDFCLLIPAGLFPHLSWKSSTANLLHALSILLFPASDLPSRQRHLSFPDHVSASDHKFPWPLILLLRLSAPRPPSHEAAPPSFRSPVFRLHCLFV